MATGNVTYEQSIGLMTAMTEITRNGAKSARGLVSIQSRYNQIIDESSSTGKKLTAWYKEHNIQIKDQNGQLRSFFEVGKDVADIWDTLSDNEKKYYLNTQAGANQSQNLAALMRNYQTAVDATATALDSAGSASEENARYMKSMEGELKNLKRAWVDFSRKMISSDALKNTIHGLTNFVNFLTTDLGQSLVKAGVGLVAFGGAFKLLGGLASLVISPFKSVNKIFGSFGKTSGKTAKSLKKVGKGMKVVKAPTIGAAKAAGKAATGFTLLGGSFSGLASILTSPAGLIAGMLALGAGIMYANTKMNQMKSPEAQYERTHKKLGQLESKYDEVTDAVEKLKKKQSEGGLTSSEEVQLEALEKEREAIKKNIEAYRELSKAQKTEAARTPDSKVNKTDKVKSKQRPVTKASPLGAMEKQAQKDAGAVDLLTSKMVLYEDASKKVAEANKKVADAQKDATKAAQSGDPNKMAKAEKKLTNAINEQESAQKNLNKSFEDMDKTNQELKEFYGSQERMPSDIRKSSEAVDNMVKSYKHLTKLNEKGGAEGVDFLGLSDGSIQKVIGDFKSLGDTIGVTVSEAGNINHIDLGTFISSMEQIGFTADETKQALALIAQENPEATITVDGADVALKDVNSLDAVLAEVNGEKIAPAIKLKGGDKVEQESGKIEDALGEVEGLRIFPEVKLKGGEKSQEEAKDTKEALEEVNGQESEASIHVEGGEETAEATKTSADALELVNGYEAEATVSQTGAEQATNETNAFQSVVFGLTGNTVQVGQTGAGQAAGEVGGLQGVVSGLTGNTVMVQEEGAAPSMGRVSALNDSINSMQSRTVQETANVSGAGSVASLVGYQNSLHNKTVTYTVITEKKQKASGTKNFEGGLAEVNEYGYEYIRDVQTGMLRVANKGRRGLTLLNKGDAVYTHGQSMQMRQKAEESLPKFASGKRSKVQKIQDKYDDAVEYLEYLQDKKHFSDSWLAKRMKKAYNKYSKKAKKAGGSLTKKQYRELSLAIENAKYDKRTESLETEVTNLGLGFGRGRGKFSKKGKQKDVLEAKEVKAERKRLKRLKKQHKISTEDYKKYMDDIYHAYIEGQMKLTLADEKSTKNMKKTLKKYVKEGKITWEEYYDYVSELNGKILDKEIESLGLGSGTGHGKYSNKGKESRYLEKSEVNAEIKRLKSLRKEGEITAEQFAEYKEEIYHNYADSQMAMYEAGKISADKMQKVLDGLVKKGEITWAEYYDYLDELEDDRHDKLINDLDKEIASLGKGTGQGAGQYSGKGKESQYLEWSEVTAERDRLKQLRKEGKITKEEYNEYMDEIYHTYVDDRMKMYETGKITAKQMQDTLANQVKYGRITWTEYYDYLDQIAEQEHEKQLARIEKEIENLGLGVGSAKGAYSTGNARYLELAEVDAEREALQALVAQGEITQEEFEGFMDTIYHKYADSQMKMYEEGKISATAIKNTLDSLVSEGKITWSEYYDYIDNVNEKIKDQQIKFIEDEINAYTLRNKSIDDAIKKIKELAKAGGLTAEEEKEYIKQIKQKYLDQYYTLYTNGKKTYQEMKSLIVQYYKDGILNAEEYYAKLDELSQNQFSVEQERLNKMQEQKENESSLAKSWIQRRIDDLEKQNEQIEKQNDLLEVQKNLEEAQAKRVKIYRQGQGFVYEKDTEAIREATKALQDYKKEQGNPEVNALKEILELFEDNEELANIKNLENITGSTYNALFGSLGTDVNLWTRWIQDNLSATNGIGLLLNAMGDIQDPIAMAQFLNADGLIDDSKIKSYINQARFASGTLSTPAGFARVGEQGYEIALLGAGNAIMPHNISEHLMSWGQYSPNDLISNIGGATYAYQFDNLVLPNVTNAQDFIRELKQLPNKAIQTSIGRTM